MIDFKARMWRERGEKIRHKARLAVEHDVCDNPKLDMLYDKAWEMGHSNGYDEVASVFADLVDLIK